MASMSLQLRVGVVTIEFVLICFANVSAARGQQKLLTPEQRHIVDTVSSMCTALRTDDTPKFDSVIAPDFYIFDGGTRFNGETIMGLIKAQHAAGKRYEWKVTEPDVHISGNTAWIAYINQGSITDASGSVNQQWLESAFLQKQAGSWKIVFMHSTRVPAQSPENRH
jgi:ketosteroid isomerase-like protein